MKIKLKNTKLLFIYRHSLFKLFSFATDNKDIENIIKALLDDINMSQDKYYEELNNKEKYNLAKALFSFKLKIKDTKSYDHAQITLGGVSLDEIKTTMESKLVDDLYIIGELLDVNGQCGGYNLAFAFISGMIAGKSAND